MGKKSYPVVEVALEKIVGGGQALGTLEDGRKIFVWGGLPGEIVRAQITKRKSSYAEGVVTEVLKSSPDRVGPKDPDSYLSTSPWQILSLDAEQHYKAALIEEAFELHDIVLPEIIEVTQRGDAYHYRNKIEYSFWYDTDRDELDLAFFRRGSHGKIAIIETSLASPSITEASKKFLHLLRDKKIEGRALKSLLIRSDASGNSTAQLYVKDKSVADKITLSDLESLNLRGTMIIYSNPKSPASVITEVLSSTGSSSLTDTILSVPFTYASEGFFQINLPIYETALSDMRQWIPTGKPVVDMYSGVGTIGLSIGGDNITLVEVSEAANNEMKRNAAKLNRKANIIHAKSETALDYITSEATIIVDPPRAGLHTDVVSRLISEAPERIIYLSCNPVTQARDVALLAERYGVRWHRGYNFFPRTPHIEHLIVLDKKT